MSKTTKRDREHAKWVRSIANKGVTYSKDKDKAHCEKLLKLSLPGWEGATVTHEKDEHMGETRIFTLGNAVARIYVGAIQESLERWV